VKGLRVGDEGLMIVRWKWNWRHEGLRRTVDRDCKLRVPEGVIEVA
jgi:hypothetical protein